MGRSYSSSSSSLSWGYLNSIDAHAASAPVDNRHPAGSYSPQLLRSAAGSRQDLVENGLAAQYGDLHRDMNTHGNTGPHIGIFRHCHRHRRIFMRLKTSLSLYGQRAARDIPRLDAGIGDLIKDPPLTRPGVRKRQLSGDVYMDQATKISYICFRIYDIIFHKRML